ncbi:MAG: class I SAM-dependent methyltransferase [Myxococcota bacterium]
MLRRQHPSAWANAVFVDLGCGERPWTTVESAARFREVWPGLPVVGVEIHPGRVAAAQAWSDGTRTRFVEGGFELGAVGHRVRLLRAMNVLRQYRPEDVAKAHAQMGARLVEGGLLVEGTCDKHGQTLAAHLMRQRGGVLRRESLLMTTDFSRGFAPLLFRDVLPRDLRRRVVPGEPIHALFEAWTAAWQEVRSGLGPRQAFVRSLQVLACRVPGVATDPWLLTRGYARWSPPGGVPQPYGRVATLG